MRVLFVATEAAPWVKVGGLGDVVGSLPRALRALGVDARIVLPAHAGIARAVPAPERVARFALGHRDGPMTAEVLATELAGVPTYLVTGPPIAPDGIVYTGRMEEEGRRFTFFSLAAVELARRLIAEGRWQPDILHCHDWHTALVPWVLGPRREMDPLLARLSTLLTIHNLPYTGRGADGELHGFGVVGTSDDRVPHDLRGAPMALGILAADRLSAVSQGYAREILTPEHGAGLDAILRAREHDLTGILNGLDVDAWNPATDPALDAPFDVDDPSPRAKNRAALQQELGLPVDDDAPILAMVGRLVPQKGVELALGALRALSGRRWQAVILGTGEPTLERAVVSLGVELGARVQAHVAFDERLARRIYAGADMLLLPSHYEPCGMAQMIGMRYGCIPVARETGGLADTVRDLDLSDRPTGVLFADPTVGSLVFALRRALAVKRRPDAWSRVMREAMSEDFSWRRSAAAYTRLYESIERARASTAAQGAS
jgi:starch synthase